MLSHASISVSLTVHLNPSKMGSWSWSKGRTRQKWEALPASRIRIPSLCREQRKWPLLVLSQVEFTWGRICLGFKAHSDYCTLQSFCKIVSEQKNLYQEREFSHFMRFVDSYPSLAFSYAPPIHTQQHANMVCPLVAPLDTQLQTDVGPHRTC